MAHIVPDPLATPRRNPDSGELLGLLLLAGAVVIGVQAWRNSGARVTYVRSPGYAGPWSNRPGGPRFDGYTGDPNVQ